MVYVPSDWIKHRGNGKKVTEILEKLDADFIEQESFSKEDAIKELEEIDESIIIKKINNGEFSFGA